MYTSTGEVNTTNCPHITTNRIDDILYIFHIIYMVRQYALVVEKEILRAKWRVKAFYCIALTGQIGRTCELATLGDQVR